MAIPIYISKRKDVLALPDGAQLIGTAGEWVGLALLGAVAFWLYRVASRKVA
jgi:hypothetical protein